jgi:hypothetical protein
MARVQRVVLRAAAALAAGERLQDRGAAAVRVGIAAVAANALGDGCGEMHVRRSEIRNGYVKVSRRLVANLYVFFSTKPWPFVQVRLNLANQALGA